MRRLIKRAYLLGAAVTLAMMAPVSCAAVYLWVGRGWGGASAGSNSTCVSGMRIREALDRHCTDRGTYPERLDDLVPAYLPSVPSPDVPLGHWVYIRNQGRSHFAPYELEARVRGNITGNRIYWSWWHKQWEWAD